MNFQRTGETTWSSGVELLAPTPQASEDFGISVDIYGDNIIVGASYWHGTEADQGRAIIYNRTGPDNIWNSGTQILSLNLTASNWFGHSVAINNEHFAIGEPGRLMSENTNINNNGVVYVGTISDNTINEDIKTPRVTNSGYYGNTFFGQYCKIQKEPATFQTNILESNMSRIIFGGRNNAYNSSVVIIEKSGTGV